MRVLLLCVVALLLTHNALAIGVSPPRIVLEDVPKGYVVERPVTLSGLTPGTTATTTITGEGSQWVAAKLGNEFVVQTDQTLEFPFIISIPEEAPNGEYEVSAQIIFSSQEKSSQPNSATVSSGLAVTISFTVTGKEVVKYHVSSVQIPSLEAGNPVLVVMNINNEGNVLVSPAEVELVIKDKLKNIITSTSTTDITPIKPYTVGESVASFDLDLDPEFYFGDVIVYAESGLQQIDDLPFDVLQTGSSQASGELVELRVQDDVEKIARIDAVFSNNGDIDLSPVLKAEVYKDNKLVDVFESDPEYVRVGDTKEFTHYYDVPESGEYAIKASAEFLGKKTSTKETTFRTARARSEMASEVDSEESSSFQYILIAVAAIILVLYILYFRRRR